MTNAGDSPLERTRVRPGRRSDTERLLDRLGELGWTIATAESVTGGLLVAELVSVPGASEYVRGGIVAYASDVKHALLGVDASFLAAHGAVQPKVARQMADGVRTALAEGDRKVDVGVATTGIAGPASPDGQPVGTVHVGVSTALGTKVTSLHLAGDRGRIRAETVRAAVRAVLEAL